jgi:hypothetical protein
MPKYLLVWSFCKVFLLLRQSLLSPYRAKVLEDVKEAVEEMKLVKEGKLKARNAEDLFLEL